MKLSVDWPAQAACSSITENPEPSLLYVYILRAIKNNMANAWKRWVGHPMWLPLEVTRMQMMPCQMRYAQVEHVATLAFCSKTTRDWAPRAFSFKGLQGQNDAPPPQHTLQHRSKRWELRVPEEWTITGSSAYSSSWNEQEIAFTECSQTQKRGNVRLENKMRMKAIHFKVIVTVLQGVGSPAMPALMGHQEIDTPDARGCHPRSH